MAAPAEYAACRPAYSLSGLSVAEYASASETAVRVRRRASRLRALTALSLQHAVLGFMLVGVVLAYGLHVAELAWPRLSLRQAYRASGALTAAGGVYLLLWVVLLAAPRDAAALRRLATADLVQQQHVVIGCLLVAAGFADLLLAALVPAPRAVHSAWFCSMASVGLVFLTHPQKDAAATVVHSVLGVAIIFGTFFLGNAKKACFDATTTLDVVVAAAAFSVAAVLLSAFEEPQESVAPGAAHRAVGFQCQSGGTLVVLGYAVAAVSFGACCAVAARAPRGGGAGTTSVSAAHEKSRGRYSVVSVSEQEAER